ncbi:MAG: hypothetical protein EHM36_12405, partial [Deltaproteobacteria bacterium]
AFQEAEIGSIEPGKAGDLVILSEDPCAVAPDKIGKISIEMTFVDGGIVFKRQES